MSSGGQPVGASSPGAALESEQPDAAPESTTDPERANGRRANAYDSERVAAAYAFDRPAVHERILRSLRLAGRRRHALDIGCGAGVSTAALASLAERVTGLEPVRTMLTHRHAVAPRAAFAIGRAERLPFAAGTFDLVAAAGSLNYADLPVALTEAARVLTPDGTLVVYDFGQGRRAVESGGLAGWFGEFERRFPMPPGYPDLDLPRLPLGDYGLRLDDQVDVEVSLPMRHDAYLRYVLSEANVTDAVAGGRITVDAARDWCARTLAEVFGTGSLTVGFTGYLATLLPR
ncbi:class I SAM-dependent methyltransferase [Rugosimonospora africana]|uniref:Methyltransferase type 11 domain-containing protein n=1 Tax=Rugosimonospora africana TaxID=556532 RepID=A0A8J3R2F1_9ACTN|nr:class I SAM-dependent methyltransferase [Rugosimonospora africana]GIH21213.1 hypothetical protein Raf01_93850 [Rugosimonospora africana]